MGGRITVESVARCSWNGWPDDRGIRNQASKEQREQEQRRHEAQANQLQAELRQLQQTLIVKQDELTQLNRDNERLITEARQQLKGQQALERLLAQRDQALSTAQREIGQMVNMNKTLKQQCDALQDEITRFDQAYKDRTEQVETLQERLAEATVKLQQLAHASAKSVTPTSPTNGDESHGQIRKKTIRNSLKKND